MLALVFKAKNWSVSGVSFIITTVSKVCIELDIQRVEGASRYVHVQCSGSLCLGSAPSAAANSCSDTCVHSWVCSAASPRGIACPPSASGNGASAKFATYRFFYLGGLNPLTKALATLAQSDRILLAHRFDLYRDKNAYVSEFICRVQWWWDGSSFIERQFSYACSRLHVDYWTKKKAEYFQC